MSDEKPKSPAGSFYITIKDRGEFLVHSAPPPPNTSVEDLQRFLDHNRLVLKQCQEDFENTFVNEVYKREAVFKLNYESSIQQALTAHQNIQILIPMLNMRGVVAAYEKVDTLDPKTRVERMLAGAEKQAHNKMTKNAPFSSIILLSLLFAGFVIYLLTLGEP